MMCHLVGSSCNKSRKENLVWKNRVYLTREEQLQGLVGYGLVDLCKNNSTVGPLIQTPVIQTNAIWVK